MSFLFCSLRGLLPLEILQTVSLVVERNSEELESESMESKMEIKFSLQLLSKIIEKKLIGSWILSNKKK